MAETLDYASTTTKKDFNPEDYRMTIGEHLDELRRRVIYALLGFLAVLVVCFIFGTQVVSYFCQPLVNSLVKIDANPQIYMSQAGDGFVVYMQICFICGAAIAGPWIIYQLWLFIAAGLYPHERKYVTRYVPVSITLLILGMLFVYFIVLPWTLDFFLGFGTDIPLHPGSSGVAPKVQVDPAKDLPVRVPAFDGDPVPAPEGAMWYDKTQGRVKIMKGGEPRVLQWGPNKLISPHITLPEYIDLVLGMLIVFGLAFQLPLVVLALLAIGIVTPEAMKGARRYVYFAMTILAAMITPGDVVTATIALLIPLCMLFELGIVLYQIGRRRKAKEQAAEDAKAAAEEAQEKQAK